MESLKEALGRINLKTPQKLEHSLKSSSSSYFTQSKKEKLLIAYAENFQRQFRQLYGDRKPLLLKPPNENGIEKFICTTLRPTQLPYKELYDYDGCSEFVADYLSYVTLSIPNELPDKIVSPTLVLSSQKGNCFDYSILLTSLLIGVGYDAYCICGYATREVTLLDQSRKQCPQLIDNEEEEELSATKDKAKYTVRPPKDLSSQFLKLQEKKEKDRIAAEEKRKKDEEEARIAELEKPPPDKFYGLRYHSWVLVLSGKREVAHSFFIEPTTGETQPLDSSVYLGIETLWNHRNCWVNMQDCSEGVKNLVYDLGDATKWEYFFPSVDKHLLLPDEERMLGEEEDDEQKEGKEHFQLPPSWVNPLTISPKVYETRCPKGKKTVLYHRAKVEKYAPYLNADGLVEKIVVYVDTARSDVLQTKERFGNRKDRLINRTTSTRTGQKVDVFLAGRKRNLKEHKYYEPKSLKCDYRTLFFYSDLRVDGLASRDHTPMEMTEHFEGREDRLYYRHVTYEKIVKRFEPADKERGRHIHKIVEKFHRDPNRSANDDISQRTYLFDERKILIVYHYEENRITPSSREFYLPVLSGDQTQLLTMNPDMTSAYQVDSYMTEPKQKVLYDMLEGLLKSQEESVAAVRQSEKETESILSTRMQEELHAILTISVYDVARNETARQHRQELERKQLEEERIRQEKEKDYLAPFLARHGDPPLLSKEQKKKVTEECLADMKKRLVDVANIIQSHFERETDDLQKKQLWYKQRQSSITKEEEVEYVSYCGEAMYRIHILEQRLNRHKTTAPHKYLELEQRLKEDMRLRVSS